jgi:hypothetical protein
MYLAFRYRSICCANLRTWFVCVMLQVVVEQGGQPWVRLLITAAAAEAAALPARVAVFADDAASQMRLSSTASCSCDALEEGPAALPAAASTPAQQLPSYEVSSAACCLDCLQQYHVLNCATSGSCSKCEQPLDLPPDMRFHVSDCPAGRVLQQQQYLL